MNKKIVFLSSFCNESHYKFEAHIINMIMDTFKKKEFIFIGHKKHVLKTLSLIKKERKNKAYPRRIRKIRRMLSIYSKKVIFYKK